MSQTIGEQWLKGRHEEFIAGRQQHLTRSRARERTVIWSHSLRNVLLPVVTIPGLQIGRTLGGLAVLTLIAAAAVLAPRIVPVDAEEIGLSVLLGLPLGLLRSTSAVASTTRSCGSWTRWSRSPAC